MDVETARRLVLVRHAKSAWPFGVPDRERPLAPRGQQDAPRMGRWIAGNVGAVDYAVLSPAARVQQTWALLSAELECGEVATDFRIYEAWGTHLVDVLREAPEDARTVVLVGHEPGVSELALTLANNQNHLLRRRIGDKYPTCAVAVLATARPWAELVPAGADLVDFVAPKDF